MRYLFDGLNLLLSAANAATEGAPATPPSSLWDVAKDATPPVALLLVAALYYLNTVNNALQTKIDALQAKHDVLLEKFITMATDSNATIKEVRGLFASLLRGRSGGSPNDPAE